jgi:hypothetical protein
MDFQTRHIRRCAAKDWTRNLFLKQPIQILVLRGVELVRQQLAWTTSFLFVAELLRC